MTLSPRLSRPVVSSLLALVATPALAEIPPAALPMVDLAPPPAGVIVAPPRLVQHGNHLAVVALLRHQVQTAKVRQGELVARYRAAGAASDTVARARCDVHRWQEACTVALTGLDGATPQQVSVAFQPRG